MTISQKRNLLEVLARWEEDRADQLTINHATLTEVKKATKKAEAYRNQQLFTAENTPLTTYTNQLASFIRNKYPRSPITLADYIYLRDLLQKATHDLQVS